MRRMMKFSGMCLMMVGLLQCAQKSPEGGIKLTGTADNLVVGGFLRMEKVGENGPEPIDTLEVKNGKFVTNIEVDEPSFYRLNFNGRQYVTLILTGEEKEVVVNAHGNDPQGYSEVSGSYDTEYKNQMDELLQSYRTESTLMQGKIRNAQASNDQAAFLNANNEMISYTRRAEKKLKGLIWESTPSLAAVYGLQMIDAEKNITFLDSVFTELDSSIPDNYLVKSIAKNIEVIRSKILAEANVTIGSIAPEIALANPEGEIVKLSSLRGNYVLIDFWAAWCRPCRMENPNVVRMYNQYSDRNFEIYGVSLDKTKEAWIQAIEQDGLTWIHVSDLKYFQSEAARTYSVGGIPATFLIDPDGKIIAKNLRGASLEAKLKEIFG
jgi:peroxiredoxin